MTSKIEQMSEAYMWSISKLAYAFGMDRRTVTRRIEDANLEPAGKKNGHPVYALKSAGPALFVNAVAPFKGDPEELQPQDRKAWYQSENERVKLEVQLRQLIPSEEVHREMSNLAKAVTSTLDSLPDILERDCDLQSAHLERIQDSLDALRHQLYVNLIDDEEQASA